MFPEHRELITKLKNKDHHFMQLFEKHNELDQKIKNMEAQVLHVSHDEIEMLKKQKLEIKDELYAYLKSFDS